MLHDRWGNMQCYGAQDYRSTRVQYRASATAVIRQHAMTVSGATAAIEKRAITMDTATGKEWYDSNETTHNTMARE